jgi:hypothetical protein
MTALTIFLTFVLLVAVLAGAVWGALLMLRRLEFLEEEQRRANVSAIEDSQRFEKLFDEFTSRIEAAERRAAEAAQHRGQSVNYTQRSQMLRMIRRGHPPEHIASTLGVPPGQVKLLMKVAGALPDPARGGGKGERIDQ